MSQIILEPIIEKMWSSISYRNLILFGVILALPMMLIVVMMNRPIAVNYDLIFDFFLALPLYASVSIVTILFAMGVMVGILLTVSWLRNVVVEKKSQFVANALLSNDNLISNIANGIEQKLLKMFRNIDNPQIQELKEKYAYEFNIQRDEIIQLKKENKILKTEINKIPELEKNIKKILKQQSHTTNNQENTDDIKNSNKIEYQD